MQVRIQLVYPNFKHKESTKFYSKDKFIAQIIRENLKDQIVSDREMRAVYALVNTKRADYLSKISDFADNPAPSIQIHIPPLVSPDSSPLLPTYSRRIFQISPSFAQILEMDSHQLRSVENFQI